MKPVPLGCHSASSSTFAAADTPPRGRARTRVLRGNPPSRRPVSVRPGLVDSSRKLCAGVRLNGCLCGSASPQEQGTTNRNKKRHVSQRQPRGHVEGRGYGMPGGMQRVPRRVGITRKVHRPVLVNKMASSRRQAIDASILTDCSGRRTCMCDTRAVQMVK